MNTTFSHYTAFELARGHGASPKESPAATKRALLVAEAVKAGAQLQGDAGNWVNMLYCYSHLPTTVRVPSRSELATH